MPRKDYGALARPATRIRADGQNGASFEVLVDSDGDVVLDDCDAGHARSLSPDSAIRLGRALEEMGLRAIAMKRS
ncbi:hypothetical protein [Ferrovibrio sp.]|uniref:hypothetical protein n=1 Tax=Ferrovibrio sp. TaxID=1917215 RepID=UPI00311E6D46